MAQLSRILMVSSEASPWAKSGGLADVASALPVSLALMGHPVAVVLPRYEAARDAPAKRILENLPILLGAATHQVSVWELQSGGTTFYFVDNAFLYDGRGLYGDENGEFEDNHIRFALLAKAALEISRLLFQPDIIHCHDWQASLVPAYLRDPRRVDPQFAGVRTLLTIHNLGYHGIFDRSVIAETGLPPEFYSPEGIAYWGKVSFLKAGIVFADALTTVSPKYAEEIQTPEFGFGLDGLLRRRRAALRGILNGADYQRWNPETDRLIPAHFSTADLAGKRVCKRELLREMGLPEQAMDCPLAGIISRFTEQKGFELMAEATDDLFSSEGVYLAALGNGEPECEQLFRDLQERFPGRISVRFGYEERLAHRIEAGADVFLMPSRYEPCGLNQIYSLRYGTVPVVRATGGLDDTVTAFPSPEATGFKFHHYNGNALAGAVHAACLEWKDREAWTAMMVRGMQKDFSWTAPAGEYSRLYSELASSGVSGNSKIEDED